MRRSSVFGALAMVTLALALAANAVPEYLLYRDECIRGPADELCPTGVYKDDGRVQTYCWSKSSFLAYITTWEEFNAALAVMAEAGVKNAYVGARSEPNPRIWMWKPDGWTYQGVSMFSRGTAVTGIIYYGENFWVNGYPDEGYGSVFVQLRRGQGQDGFINANGRDVAPFYVLCEKTRRNPPVVDGATWVIGTTTSSNPDPNLTRKAPVIDGLGEVLPPWAIGAIAGSVTAVIIIACIILVCLSKRAAKDESDDYSDETDEDDEGYDSDDTRSFYPRRYSTLSAPASVRSFH